MKYLFDDQVSVPELFELLGKMDDFKGDRFPARKVFHVSLRDENKESIALKNTISVTARDKHNQLIGYLRVISDNAYIYYILDVMVDPKYRNKYIGTKLMELAIEKAKMNGFIKIFLTAIPGSESFYSQFGFQAGMSPVLTIRGEDYV